jgi:hypothetical protein
MREGGERPLLDSARVLEAVMKFRTRPCFTIFMIAELIGLMLFGYMAEPLEAADLIAEGELSLSALVSVQPHLSLSAVSPFVAEGKIVGVLAAYDDVTTKRAVDYWEVYDSENHLLVVCWFDRFGIERTAVDRALLGDGAELEGVFVPFIEGDSI